MVCGTVFAALFSGAIAIAAPAPIATLPSQAAHVRGSFFTSSQKRADVGPRIERLFKELDVNHDGFVTRDELAALQTQFDERTSKSAPKRAARMFDRLDTNHDGQITRAEFDAARTARLAAKAKQAKSSGSRSASSLFVRADSNRDGIVTRAEFDAAIAGGKIKLRHANMRGSSIVRLFDAADTNKDGRVSLEDVQQAALRQFDAADVDHDGVLAPEERRQAAKAARAKRHAS
jgi:Ca2+-binding EF-hand superfamily protein